VWHVSDPLCRRLITGVRVQPHGSAWSIYSQLSGIAAGIPPSTFEFNLPVAIPVMFCTHLFILEVYGVPDNTISQTRFAADASTLARFFSGLEYISYFSYITTYIGTKLSIINIFQYLKIFSPNLKISSSHHVYKWDGIALPAWPLATAWTTEGSKFESRYC
jgi:hypothetical protein